MTGTGFVILLLTCCRLLEESEVLAAYKRR